jgi:hypothetical protein
VAALALQLAALLQPHQRLRRGRLLAQRRLLLRRQRLSLLKALILTCGRMSKKKVRRKVLSLR